MAAPVGLTDTDGDTDAPSSRGRVPVRFPVTVVLVGVFLGLGSEWVAPRVLSGSSPSAEWGGRDPTLSTIADLAYALNLEVEGRIKERPRRSRKPLTPVRLLTAEATVGPDGEVAWALGEGGS